MLKVLFYFMATVAATELLSCDTMGPDYVKFGARTFAQSLLGQTTSFAGHCFENISVTLRQSDGELTAELIAQGHKGGLCVDLVIVTSGNTSKISFLYLEAKEELRFDTKRMTTAEYEYVLEKGFKVLRGCDNVLNFPADIFMTLKLYFGGLGMDPNIPIFGSKIPDYQLKANMDWAAKSTGYEWKLRSNPATVRMNKDSIKSGDFISIIRFDGLDNLIHTGTGSRSGHNTMALWRDGELYVIESQDAWYWPRKGIQRNKWDDWIKWAENADYNVAIIPLSDKMRAKFDVENAWKEFDRLEGLSYGFSNFLFGYVDTTTENLPDWLDLTYLSLVLSVLENFIPDNMISRVFYEPLNMRLKTKGLNMRGIWEELYKRKMSMEDLWAMVEVDGWQYSSGENYVCSAFVVHIYKAAGLFGDLKINSTEFTPKDLYELNFYDVSGDKVPEECRDFAPHGYCQVTGKIDLNLGRMNWVEPYDHMAETCPTIAPDYNRRDKC